MLYKIVVHRMFLHHKFPILMNIDLTPGEMLRQEWYSWASSAFDLLTTTMDSPPSAAWSLEDLTGNDDPVMQAHMANFEAASNDEPY